MNREEAIETLGHVVPFATQNGEKIAEAIDMAIEALSADAVEVKAEQLPPKVPTEWINDGMVLVPQHDWIEMQKELEGYVSADAVQGEWIRLIEYVPESNESLINFDGYQCSVCGGKLWADSFNFWNYCPNCGARMENTK